MDTQRVLTIYVSMLTLHSVQRSLLLRRTTKVNTMYLMALSKPSQFMQIAKHGEDIGTPVLTIEEGSEFILRLTIKIE